MILQREHHAAFFGACQTSFDSPDHPFKAFFLRVARKDGFDTPLFHQLVEVFDRSPAASVDAQAGDAHCVTDLDALLRVLDFASHLVGIGRKERLMRGEADETYAFAESLTLEFLEISTMTVGKRLAFRNGHLAMENVHAGDSEVRGFVHYGFDRDFGIAEVPVRIGAKAEFERRSRGRVSTRGVAGTGAESGGSTQGCSCSEEVSAVHSEISYRVNPFRRILRPSSNRAPSKRSRG